MNWKMEKCYMKSYADFQDIKISIETVKNFWDARPCNIRHSMEAIGTKRYFDEVEKRKYLVEPHIKEFADFPRWKGKKVLEIGCGIGTDTINFARAGAQITAIDLSSESLILAKKRAEIYSLQDKIQFYQGNAEKLDSIIPIDTFDLVYSFGVIHHTPYPQKIIQKIQKYMHSSSELRLMVYAKKSWKNIMINAGFDQHEAQKGCPVAYTYTDEEIRRMLKCFDILSITQDHIFPFDVEEYQCHKYVLQPWFSAMPQEMFRVLEQALGWHMLIIAKLL